MSDGSPIRATIRATYHDTHPSHTVSERHTQTCNDYGESPLPMCLYRSSTDMLMSRPTGGTGICSTRTSSMASIVSRADALGVASACSIACLRAIDLMNEARSRRVRVT